MLCSINVSYPDYPTVHEALDIVIFYCSLFRICQKLVWLGNFNTNFNITSKTLQNYYGFRILISKINYIYLIRDIKGIMTCITWLNAIYFASVMLKVISIWSLTQNKTEHPTYFIMYPKRYMTFYVLLAYSWYQPTAKLASTSYSIPFYLSVFKLLHV